MVQIFRLHPEEIVPVTFFETIEKHAVEVLIQLGGCVFDEHLHLINQLGRYFTSLTLSAAFFV